MTEGVAQDGKASGVLQDMGKVLLGHTHGKWLFGRSVPASVPAGNCVEAPSSRDPRGCGTGGKRMLSDRDAVGGKVAAL